MINYLKTFANKIFKREEGIPRDIWYIIIFAFFYRVIGITHGFPYIFNVDEPTVVRATIALRDSFNPGHFDWPHFYYYINGIFYTLYSVAAYFLELVRLRGIMESFLPLLWDTPTVLYLMSRLVTAGFSSFSAVPIYLIAREFYGRKLSIVASGLFVLIPFNVFHSHFALLESALVFFMSFSLLFSVKLFKTGNLKYYVLAGVFAGLSASVKYNGGLIIFNMFLASFLYFYARDAAFIKAVKDFVYISHLKKLFIGGVVSLVIFIAASPYIVLDYGTFLRDDAPEGFLWQFENLGKIPFEEYPYAFVYHLFYQFPVSLSVAVWGLWMFRLFLFTYFQKREVKDYLFAVFPFLYFLYVIQFERQPQHYFMPMYPFILLMVLDMLVMIRDKVSAKRFGWVVAAVFVIVFAQSFYLKYTVLNPDSRYLAAEWLRVHVSEGEQIVLFGGDFPPFDEDKLRVRDEQGLNGFEYNDLARKDYPDYVVWSDYELWYDSDSEIIRNEREWEKLEEKIEEQDGKIIRFSGDHNLGPNIVIFFVNW